MIELKQVYAGRAHYLDPILDPLGTTLAETLKFDTRALPEELITKSLKNWCDHPFVGLQPLQLPIGRGEGGVYDVFIYVYVAQGWVYATLEDAKLGDPATGWSATCC